MKPEILLTCYRRDILILLLRKPGKTSFSSSKSYRLNLVCTIRLLRLLRSQTWPSAFQGFRLKLNHSNIDQGIYSETVVQHLSSKDHEADTPYLLLVLEDLRLFCVWLVTGTRLVAFKFGKRFRLLHQFFQTYRLMLRSPLMKFPTYQIIHSLEEKALENRFGIDGLVSIPLCSEFLVIVNYRQTLLL